ncbi:hypothetical protein HETIRDRAFT_419147 [Heterobasidion irregulare TC 32-1]|uniref:Uncharacterized protein n=1 Tax=Heterobasidion irregulare (strain TC 32-1) TaxID=747525 RepID=W4K230_HETIT|nr:uncharacterized protein HETIRDRAFT_419147 [Heterobasidion irregulare TC 32-1]ETW79400.1 hypothetical protein HETIRDRAFT_419147 [Heterobasidion irregulare TC 32-1]
MLFFSLAVTLFASLSAVGAVEDEVASPTSSSAVVTATRLVKGLAEEYPFFVTSTQVVVWTQTPEATPA